MKALIALEDDTVFEGKSFGIDGEREGEIVFNTSMTSYQEIMTDPSYKGQIVTMTYPLIGNYGINDEDVESSNPKVEGFIVREFSKIASNFRAKGDLYTYFKKHKIIAVEDVDTRALTKHIRARGAMKAVISTIDLNPESLIEKAKKSRGIIGIDLVREVTCKESYVWSDKTMDDGRWTKKLRTQNSELDMCCYGFWGKDEHPEDAEKGRMPCEGCSCKYKGRRHLRHAPPRSAYFKWPWRP